MAEKQKPLLFGNVKIEATALEDIERFEADGFDNSYVPGYSEQRRANEIRVRDGHKPIPLDRLYWSRVARVDGSNVDYRDAVGVSRLGYRACTVEDLRDRGWGMPPGAHVAADGLIRREDTALAIVDYARAEKNRQKQREINDEFEGKHYETHMASDAVKVSTEQKADGVSLRAAQEALLGR